MSSIRYLVFGIVFLFMSNFLSAQTTEVPKDDPVIKAAETLAASLADEYRVQAFSEIHLVKQKLGVLQKSDGDSSGTYLKAIETAKSEKDAQKRSQLFAMIVQFVIPESIHSYDDILKEESGYFVLEQIMEQCRQTGKNDLAYPLYEKIINMQTDPGMKENMRHYINRVFPMQIYTGKMAEAIASAERLEDPELRQFVLDQIQKTGQQHFLQTLQHQRDTGEKFSSNLLEFLYPDIDASNWPDCLPEIMERMQEDVGKIEDPSARFDSYLNLINMYRRVHGMEPRYAFDPLVPSVPQEKKPTSPDPVLQGLLHAATEAAKKNDMDSGQLAFAARLSIDNADEQAANRIVDLMLMITEQPHNPNNPSIRVESMFDVLPLLYQLKRTDEANEMSDAILQIAESKEGKRYGMSDVLTRVIAEKQNVGLFDEAEQLIANAQKNSNVLYKVQLVGSTAQAYGNHISRLLSESRYEDALEFIDERSKVLGEKILLMIMVGDKYRESGNTEKSNEVYEKTFELVDILAEREAEKSATGKPDNLGIQDDRRGWQGASLAKSYSHPIVQKRRERGDLVGAIDLGRKLFATHVPSIEILYIAREYADAGDYDSAIEVGGDAAGRFGSDSGIRGYAAHVMYEKGQKSEAEKLLAETLHEIEEGRMTLHGDFIVGLLLCEKVEEGIHLASKPAVVNVLEDETPNEESTAMLSLLLKCLLVSDQEERAMQLIEQWPSRKIKAWGIWTLIRWNQEEHIDQGSPSLLTPEWKQKWSAFLANYADSLEQTEPNAQYRVGEWNRAADCLIELGDKDTALKILDKALKTVQTIDTQPAEYGTTHVPMETGKILFKLHEHEKAKTAFSSAIQACRYVKEDYRKIDYFKHILVEYAAAMTTEKPEHIRNWPGYEVDYGRTTPLKELWNRNLFSSYPIM